MNKKFYIQPSSAIEDWKVDEAYMLTASDEEGNSYSTIEKSTGKSFSSFAIIPTKDKKNIKSVIIYPWREGLTDEEVGLLEDE